MATTSFSPAFKGESQRPGVGERELAGRVEGQCSFSAGLAPRGQGLVTTLARARSSCPLPPGSRRVRGRPWSRAQACECGVVSHCTLRADGSSLRLTHPLHVTHEEARRLMLPRDRSPPGVLGLGLCRSGWGDGGTKEPEGDA